MWNIRGRRGARFDQTMKLGGGGGGGGGKALYEQCFAPPPSIV